MKKLLILLFFSLGFIGTTSANIVDNNILKLKALNSCASCYLNSADLSEEHLKHARLNGADPSGAYLNGTDLRGVNLNGVTLCNTKTPWGIDDSGC